MASIIESGIKLLGKFITDKAKELVTTPIKRGLAEDEALPSIAIKATEIVKKVVPNTALKFKFSTPTAQQVTIKEPALAKGEFKAELVRGDDLIKSIDKIHSHIIDYLAIVNRNTDRTFAYAKSSIQQQQLRVDETKTIPAIVTKAYTEQAKEIFKLNLRVNELERQKKAEAAEAETKPAIVPESKEGDDDKGGILDWIKNNPLTSGLGAGLLGSLLRGGIRAAPILAPFGLGAYDALQGPQTPDDARKQIDETADKTKKDLEGATWLPKWYQKFLLKGFKSDTKTIDQNSDTSEIEQGKLKKSSISLHSATDINLKAADTISYKARKIILKADDCIRLDAPKIVFSTQPRILEEEIPANAKPTSGQMPQQAGTSKEMPLGGGGDGGVAAGGGGFGGTGATGSWTGAVPDKDPYRDPNAPAAGTSYGQGQTFGGRTDVISTPGGAGIVYPSAGRRSRTSGPTTTTTPPPAPSVPPAIAQTNVRTPSTGGPPGAEPTYQGPRFAPPAGKFQSKEDALKAGPIKGPRDGFQPGPAGPPEPDTGDAKPNFGGSYQSTDHSYSGLTQATGLKRQDVDVLRNLMFQQESGKKGYGLNDQGDRLTSNFGFAQYNMEDVQRTAAYLGEKAPTKQELLSNPKLQEKYYEGYLLSRMGTYASRPEWKQLVTQARSGDAAARQRVLQVLAADQVGKANDVLSGRLDVPVQGNNPSLGYWTNKIPGYFKENERANDAARRANAGNVKPALTILKVKPTTDATPAATPPAATPDTKPAATPDTKPAATPNLFDPKVTELEKQPTPAGPPEGYLEGPTTGKLHQGPGATRSGHTHAGVDAEGAPHSPIINPSQLGPGVVVKSEQQGGITGGIVTVLHDNGKYSKHMHVANTNIVKPGQRVGVGDQLGTVGLAGGLWHDHFEIYDGYDRKTGRTGPRLNPSDVMKWPKATTTEGRIGANTYTVNDLKTIVPQATGGQDATDTPVKTLKVKPVEPPDRIPMGSTLGDPAQLIGADPASVQNVLPDKLSQTDEDTSIPVTATPTAGTITPVKPVPVSTATVPIPRPRPATPGAPLDIRSDAQRGLPLDIRSDAQKAPVTTQPPAMPRSKDELNKMLTGLASQSKEKLAWKSSVVDTMKLLKMDSSQRARKKLAADLGYTGKPKDSAKRNKFLQQKIMEQLIARSADTGPEEGQGKGKRLDATPLDIRSDAQRGMDDQKAPTPAEQQVIHSGLTFPEDILPGPEEGQGIGKRLDPMLPPPLPKRRPKPTIPPIVTPISQKSTADLEAQSIEIAVHQKNIESYSYWMKAEREKERAKQAETRVKETETKNQEQEKNKKSDPKKSPEKAEKQTIKKITHSPETERQHPNDSGYGEKREMTNTQDHMEMQE